MIRKLIDYKKLDHSLAALLIESYPYGYGDEDIIVFKNAHGDMIRAVEIRTEDTIYLVKISKSLAHFICNFEDEMIKELGTNTDNTTSAPTLPQQELEYNEDLEGIESELD